MSYNELLPLLAGNYVVVQNLASRRYVANCFPTSAASTASTASTAFVAFTVTVELLSVQEIPNSNLPAL